MGNDDICGGTIQEWRQTMGTAIIVDLKSVYLQLHVEEKLWWYQLVRYKGTTYRLKRLGFGLDVVPKNHGDSSQDFSKAGRDNRAGHKIQHR